MPSDIKIGLTDYVLKIVGGVVTFGLIAIDLKKIWKKIYPLDFFYDFLYYVEDIEE